MKILVTGIRGFLGNELESALIKNKIDYIGFDILDGDDLFDIKNIESKIEKCDIVIHLATYKPDYPHKNEIGYNILGLTNLLELSAKYKIKKFINLSSVDATGIFKGQSEPDYFPIDEEHSCNPSTDYGISKKMCEDLCNYYGEFKNLSIITLRPPGIWNEEVYQNILQLRKQNPEYEWKPFWEYGAFIDIRDLVSLLLKICKTDFPIGNRIYNVCSDDITSSGKTSIELSRMVHPIVHWKDHSGHIEKPYKTILCNDKVKKDFKWKPIFSWERFIKTNS